VPPLFSGAPIFGAYGTSALLYAPFGVALSPDETVLYFAEANGHRVRCGPTTGKDRSAVVRCLSMLNAHFHPILVCPDSAVTLATGLVSIVAGSLTNTYGMYNGEHPASPRAPTAVSPLMLAPRCTDLPRHTHRRPRSPLGRQARTRTLSSTTLGGSRSLPAREPATAGRVRVRRAPRASPFAATRARR